MQCASTDLCTGKKKTRKKQLSLPQQGNVRDKYIQHSLEKSFGMHDAKWENVRVGQPHRENVTAQGIGTMTWVYHSLEGLCFRVRRSHQQTHPRLQESHRTTYAQCYGQLVCAYYRNEYLLPNALDPSQSQIFALHCVINCARSLFKKLHGPPMKRKSRDMSHFTGTTGGP